MRTSRVIPFALAGLLALGATGCAGTDFKRNAPQTAVRNFLSEALVEQNGQRACDYLTPAQQEQFLPASAVASAQQSAEPAQVAAVACRDALEKATLVDGSDRIANVGDVNQLGYSTTRSGSTATVTVNADGRRLVFKVQKTNPASNLYDAENPWRVTEGATALVVGNA